MWVPGKQGRWRRRRTSAPEGEPLRVLWSSPNSEDQDGCCVAALPPSGLFLHCGIKSSLLTLRGTGGQPSSWEVTPEGPGPRHCPHQVAQGEDKRNRKVTPIVGL